MRRWVRALMQGCSPVFAGCAHVSVTLVSGCGRTGSHKRDSVNFLRRRLILTLDGGGLSVDRDELLRLVDKPASPPGVQANQPSSTRRESRKLDTNERYEGWRKAAKELRRKPQGKSERWVSLQIAKRHCERARCRDHPKKHSPVVRPMNTAPYSERKSASGSIG